MELSVKAFKISWSQGVRTSWLESACLSVSQFSKASSWTTTRQKRPSSQRVRPSQWFIAHIFHNYKTVDIQGYFELREPIRTRENCCPLIWWILSAYIYVGAVSYFSKTFLQSAVSDGSSFELGNNPGHLKCDSIFKLPCSALLWLCLLYLIKWFAFNEVRIKSSDIVLVHAFLSVSSLPRNYYQFFRPH